MDPDKQLGAVSRENFDRLRGYIIGLTNAVRALIEAAPDKEVALEAVERCFETESAMGQSFEFLDHWEREGLVCCLKDLRMPTRHDMVIDADPDGLIAKAVKDFSARQSALNASVMAKLIRPPSNDSDTKDPS